VYEAKTHLPRLLEEVARTGKTYVITKHGVSVARLVPIRSGATRPEEVIAELRRAREGITLGDVTIRDLIEDGRR
jgi:prevent-host-death family protein